MLVTMLTAMYIMVRTVESIGSCFARRPEPIYMVHQPLPWQIHSVSRRRKSSRMTEFEGPRKNSIGLNRRNPTSLAIASASMAIPCFLSCSDNAALANGESATLSATATVFDSMPPLSPVEVEKAAATIQNHFRKFQQQKKQKDDK